LLTKTKADMNFKQLISLEWKSFKRASNLLQTILMGVGKAYFGACYFIIMVAFSFAIFEVDESAVAIESFFKYAIYFLGRRFGGSLLFSKNAYGTHKTFISTKHPQKNHCFLCFVQSDVFVFQLYEYCNGNCGVDSVVVLQKRAVFKHCFCVVIHDVIAGKLLFSTITQSRQ